jgi:hypothetical protein
MNTTDLDTNQEKPDAVAVHLEIPNEEDPVETTGAPKDWSVDHEPAAGYCNPKERWAKDDVMWGAPKGWTVEKRLWTQLKFSNGIRDRGLKQQLLLRSKGNVSETLRQTIVLEVIKLAAS